MGNFHGISPEARELLAQNRFHDSKPFYEEHKQELKEKTTDEMRRLTMDLADTLQTIDDEIDVNPTYAVSRIRRDTRFSKNKMLYREHMWMMFRRPRADRYASHTAMWFEFMPGGFDCGVGYCGGKPVFMEYWRKRILEHPEEVRKAIKAAKRGGLNGEFESYKRPKEGQPAPDLLPYYNAKEIFFIKHYTDMALLNSPALVEELKKTYKTMAPMYHLLQEIHFEVLELE